MLKRLRKEGWVNVPITKVPLNTEPQPKRLRANIPSPERLDEVHEADKASEASEESQDEASEASEEQFVEPQPKRVKKKQEKQEKQKRPFAFFPWQDEAVAKMMADCP